MSVIGFDIGNKNCVIAVARRGGVDILDNEASNRQTPTMVTFPIGATTLQPQRLIGESAQTNLIRNVRGSVLNVKRFLGLRKDDPFLAGELKRQPCPVKEAVGGRAGFASRGSDGEERVFTAEQIMGMLLQHLKVNSERETKSGVRDVVISVPGWWGERQRRAMLDAAEIAGLNVLRLVNEHAAVALGYGIYKTDLPEKDPRRVMFVDMGHSSTTAAVVEFVKGKLTVKSVAYDPNLGGRDFDEAVAGYLAAEAQKKTGDDPRQNPRQWQRLLAAAEKQVKRVISAGTPSAHVSVDNLANDRDFTMVLPKETFCTLIAPLLDRVAGPIKQALEAAGVEAADLASVEAVGGGMRLPQVQERVEALLGRPLSKTLNMEEAAARGCALMCAMLSPVFRVREFKVEDITTHPIRISWKSIGLSDKEAPEAASSAIIIMKNNAIPAPKSISFARTQGIEFQAAYDLPENVPGAGPEGWIGTYTISAIPPTSSGETPKLKVRARLDANGCFGVDGAETMETIEETVVVEAKPEDSKKKKTTDAAAAAAATTEKKADPASPAASPAAGTDDTKKMDVEGEEKKDSATTPAAAAAAAPEKKTEVRKRVEKKAVAVQTCRLGLDKAQLQKMVELEGQMQAADRLALDTAEAKNHLESYQYTMRDKLAGDLGKYEEAATVAAFVNELQAVSNWLYEDGECQTKGVYVDRLQKLQAVGNKIVARRDEAIARPAAIDALEKSIQYYTDLAASADEKYSHISQEDRKKVSDRCAETAKWLDEQKKRQDATPITKDPVVTVATINAKKALMETFCRDIMNKPKPAPKKEEPKKEEKQEEKKQEQQPEEKKPEEKKKEEEAEKKQPEEKATDMEVEKEESK